MTKAAAGKLDWEDSDRLAIESIRGNPHAFVSILFSQSYPHLQEILSHLNEGDGRVLYFKPIYLRGGGPQKRLVTLMYGELCEHISKWVTNPRTLQRFSRKRFEHPHPIYGVYLELASKEKALAAKESIREKFQVGRTGIHITDNQWESIRLAELLFDDKRIEHLNRY